jgi:transposase
MINKNGRKVGKQRSSLFMNKGTPRRQVFPEWMLRAEIERAEQAKRVGHQLNQTSPRSLKIVLNVVSPVV